FFFQAEDGIRDKLVTGVQTCALPIASASRITGTLPSMTTVMRTGSGAGAAVGAVGSSAGMTASSVGGWAKPLGRARGRSGGARARLTRAVRGVPEADWNSGHKVGTAHSCSRNCLIYGV